MQFIYIHGFNSSSLSTKAQVFMKWCEEKGHTCLCHDLPYEPAKAISLLSETIRSCTEEPKLLGSSLGGFYTTILAETFSLKGIAINPAVHPGLLLRPALGPQTSWHGDYEYEFTQQHLDELITMDIAAITQPDNILMMQEREDETLDWKESVAFYRECHQLIFRGGHHGFSRFEDVLELIERF